MKNRKEILDLIVGVLGLVAIICGLFGIGRMSAFWRLIHVAGGAVMAYSELPSLVKLYNQIFKKQS